MQTILVGVTGGIAAYKTVQLVSDLIKKGYDVEVIMTKNATEFITPLTFSSLTKHDTYVDTFSKHVHYSVEHISLAKKADLFIIAPATANVIAKIASGIADDMLTTTFLACDCPKVICPAMNTNMYENPITKDNIEKLKHYGMHIVEPTSGLLACGDVGKGKLVDIEVMIDAIEMYAHKDKPLKGKTVLVSAGATKEAIDPVRYITNHSSGKMGYSIAKAARNLGADVILVSGSDLKDPYGINVVTITSAKEMKEVIDNYKKEADYIIMAAAVADYRPRSVSDHKIKKSDDMSLVLERTDDILKGLGKDKTYKLCGFAMETDDLIENAMKKFKEKDLDMIVANDLNTEGAGFKGDTNVVTIITKDNIEKLGIMTKSELGYAILERLMEVK